ncbi:MAG TPA: hypothetical protein GYA10_11970 [Alphaproteobacteria bacterium]|nr:hypothetical protein [Alphaproteobacteria bacterium]
MAVPAGAEASNAAADDGAANPAVPPPAVAALAERIARLAAALEDRASGLADKLAALGRALAAGEVAPAQLAELGLPTETGKTDAEVAEPVARLLAPTVDPRPRPAPVPFAPPSLTLPAIGVRGDSADASDEEHPTTRPALAKVPEPTVAAEAVARVPVAGRPAATAAPAMPGSQPATPVAGATTMPPSTGSTDPAPGSQQPAVAPTALPAAPTAETRAIHAAYRPVVPHLNMPQLAVEIVRQVEAGATRFQIRLDPPELGRVEVKLDVDKAGNVHARMTVDRAETLDLMQRDQRALERALAQAGLDSSKTNLEFSLRQNPFARDGNGQQQGGQQQPGVPRLGTPTAAEPLAPTILATHAVSAAGGINLFV